MIDLDIVSQANFSDVVIACFNNSPAFEGGLPASIPPFGRGCGDSTVCVAQNRRDNDHGEAELRIFGDGQTFSSEGFEEQDDVGRTGECTDTVGAQGLKNS